MRKLCYVVALLLLFIPVVAAQGSQAMVMTITPTTEADGSVTITISGSLPNSCVDLANVSYAISDRDIAIAIETTEPDPTVMCAQALVDFTTEVVIPADELTAGDYRISAGRISVPFSYGDASPAPESTEAPTAASTRIPPVRIPDVCIIPNREQALFVDTDHNFCFTYPLQFELTDDESAIVALVQAAADSASTVSFTLVQSTDRVEVSQELRADLETAIVNEDGSLAVEQGTFAGEKSLVVDTLRGDVTSRRVYILGSDTFTILTLTPNPDLNEDASALWESLNDTFAFFPSVEDGQ
ncbi:MAG: hypothetical protein KC496_07760 [Anaerolineae bacterium]|nr:hypothetical protein [Anaerolineae bacterium]